GDGQDTIETRQIAIARLTQRAKQPTLGISNAGGAVHVVPRIRGHLSARRISIRKRLSRKRLRPWRHSRQKRPGLGVIGSHRGSLPNAGGPLLRLCYRSGEQVAKLVWLRDGIRRDDKRGEFEIVYSCVRHRAYGCVDVEPRR